MVDFAKLKATSGAAQLQKLEAELEKLQKTDNSSGDGRFWYPQQDKAGNGFSIVRLLPAPGDEQSPWAMYYDHDFKGPSGARYYEKCLSSIGQKDPVLDLNSKLWEMSKDDKSATRMQARAQSRKQRYVSNVYVIEDRVTPENNGKVFLFRYGKKIFEKIQSAMAGDEAAEIDKMNPFDLWSGANFNIRIKTVSDFRNFDDSLFLKVKPLFNNDDEMEAVWKQTHSLKEFTDPVHYKSYEALKERMNAVLGSSPEGSHTVQRVAHKSKAQDIGDDIPYDRFEDTSDGVKTSKNTHTEEESDLNYFQNLANK